LVIASAGAVFVALLVGHDALHASSGQFLEWPLALAGWWLAGRPVITEALLNLRRGKFLDENFLMTLATAGAFALHQLPEAVGVMLFYSVGEHLQDLAVGKSRQAIRSLLDLRPAQARLRSLDGTERMVAPEALAVGDLAVVRPGERVPVDGTVVEGEGFVDTSSLTGESVPRRLRPGSAAAAGFLSCDALLTIRADRPAAESAATRILRLVEEARSRKAPTERFITTFSRWYTPLVVLGAVGLALVPPFWGAIGWHESLRRALVFLVTSCPCALLISVPLGYFGGLGAASRKGLLVKGADILDQLARARTAVFDKTGTLTQGNFALKEIEPLAEASPEEILTLAAMAESQSNHPLAQAVARAAQEKGLVWERPAELRELRGEGILCGLLAVGNRRLMARQGIDTSALAPSDASSAEILVACDGRLLGRLAVGDELRPEAPATMEELRALGMTHLEILSGDHRGAVQAVADHLGIQGHGELRPEDKLSRVEELEAKPGQSPVIFVGDGLNDAPVLARADAGVAMGGQGNNAALEVADMALLHGRLDGIPQGIRIARRTRMVVWQNIALALGVKAVVLTLGGAGLANLWEAIFADVGVALLAVLNSLRTLRA
jgi:Cd2+/Zn2+-exporting ATPase